MTEQDIEQELLKKLSDALKCVYRSFERDDGTPPICIMLY